jgi:hypothetical protein|tara:strand:- start:1368 stop:1544 length:177 start_codon:yes stop_codon:yes gene_type:complete
MNTNITILNTNANTPPNFDGIHLRIAYANKKYHSGTICAGVDNGLAGIQLSAWPNVFG